MSWSRGWPVLDARGRVALVIGDGPHELGLGLGLATVRLASQLSYTTHATFALASSSTDQITPVATVSVGGATDVLVASAQSRLVLGVAFGFRARLGPHVALRVELTHELLLGQTSFDRTSFLVGLEYLGGG